VTRIGLKPALLAAAVVGAAILAAISVTPGREGRAHGAVAVEGATDDLSLDRRRAPNPGVWGFADTHAHQFANLAFGGGVFWGSPFGDAAAALAPCSIGHCLTFGIALHHRDGYDTYRGWPRWNTLVHQQMYAGWLRRAHAGGLSLMVMLAVNSEVLCRAAHGSEAPCQDWQSIPQQFEAARQMQAYIERYDGGWYRIVSTPEEARRAIAAGSLAVVLGIEADDPFPCARRGACTETEVRTTLRRYYAMGVRHFFPIHLSNNQFGGMAVFPGPDWNFANRYMTGQWLNVESCAGAGVEFDVNRDRQVFAANAFALVHGLGTFGNPPRSTAPPGHCNSEGLTASGRFLIEELIRQHFVVDIDHMSRKAADETLAIAERLTAPVVAGHTTPLGAARGQRRSEYARSDAQLDRIRALGGLVSVGLAEVGLAAESAHIAGAPPNDCSNSSSTWTQQYLYAIAHMGGRDAAAVGVSTDQSFVKLIGPRYGPDACSGGPPGERRAQTVKRRLTYPISVLSPNGLVHLPPSRDGGRTFDFNVDGMAHVGMFPDFFADLMALGVTAADLAPVFRSADRYIELWEKLNQVPSK
jgi:microsomal dipeptidase-like Zn-dependent dipeptidase